ncbi:MAG: hypothetical protein HQL68_12790, partial [Magnetococcales bacterium]|nr:hypothetical protein [Magnetococcales bacterium]
MLRHLDLRRLALNRYFAHQNFLADRLIPEVHHQVPIIFPDQAGILGLGGVRQ